MFTPDSPWCELEVLFVRVNIQINYMIGSTAKRATAAGFRSLGVPYRDRRRVFLMSSFLLQVYSTNSFSDSLLQFHKRPSLLYLIPPSKCKALHSHRTISTVAWPTAKNFKKFPIELRHLHIVTQRHQTLGHG